MNRLLRPLPFLLVLPLLAGAFMLPGSVNRSQQVRSWYLAEIDSLRAQIETLADAIEAVEEEGPDRARDLFEPTKLRYKRIEPLVAHLDRYNAHRLNGPPLLKVDESDLQRTIIEPEGFQILEEVLFSDEPDAVELTRLAVRLRYRGKALAESARLPFDDRRIFEALRSGVLRIAYLNLTGFDSPVLSNSLAESAAALEGIAEIWSHYAPEAEKRSEDLVRRIDANFAAAIDELRAGDFDTFDRLSLLRNRLDPLYADLLAAHYLLGISTWSEVTPFTRAVRYETPSIFDADLLDPWFYSPDGTDRLREERVELGEMLFYDTRLSRANDRSCVSCHDPDLAFTDTLPTSLGLDGRPLDRNAPTLLNVAFQTKFFWDGRAETLEQQIEDVVLNHAELEMSFEELIARLRRDDGMRERFGSVYQGSSDTAITKFGITRALAAYMRTLVSLDAPFDRYLRGQTSSIDPSVKRGFNLFMGKAACGTCHFAPIYNGVVPPDYHETETEVLGVTETNDFERPVLDDDPGRENTFGDAIYLHSFKTPTLRHIAETAPYMHNGSQRTLEEVIDFYDRGGGAGMGLDVPNQTLPPDRLDLTEQEKADLIAFLRAL